MIDVRDASVEAALPLQPQQGGSGCIPLCSHSLEEPFKPGVSEQRLEASDFHSGSRSPQGVGKACGRPGPASSLLFVAGVC